MLSMWLAPGNLGKSLIVADVGSWPGIGANHTPRLLFLGRRPSHEAAGGDGRIGTHKDRPVARTRPPRYRSPCAASDLGTKHDPRARSCGEVRGRRRGINEPNRKRVNEHCCRWFGPAPEEAGKSVTEQDRRDSPARPEPPTTIRRSSQGHPEFPARPTAAKQPDEFGLSVMELASTFVIRQATVHGGCRPSKAGDWETRHCSNFIHYSETLRTLRRQTTLPPRTHCIQTKHKHRNPLSWPATPGCQLSFQGDLPCQASRLCSFTRHSTQADRDSLPATATSTSTGEMAGKDRNKTTHCLYPRPATHATAIIFP